MLQEGGRIEGHRGGQIRCLCRRLALALIGHQRMQRPSMLCSHLALHAAEQLL
jgi:hypothetical protein